MKHKFKKFISILLAFIIMLSVINMALFSVGAAGTSRTQAEALAWVKSVVGKSIDADGVYGAQCVDLILAYYDYLGVPRSSGNGGDYAYNTLPSGWSRIQGAAPQPGDILVYTGGYGHVAIFESNNSTYHQNFNGPYVERITYTYNKLSNPYWGVIRPNFNTHTHSYSSVVTKQPTCTSTGVRTFTCSCGSSYTESIPATGHKYTTTVIAPTTTEKGYTLHKCSVCGDSYKDNYINPPTLGSNGWYYCNALPSDVTSDKYNIQYNNYYEKIQKTSPGSDWKMLVLSKMNGRIPVPHTQLIFSSLHQIAGYLYRNTTTTGVYRVLDLAVKVIMSRHQNLLIMTKLHFQMTIFTLHGQEMTTDTLYTHLHGQTEQQ